MPDELRPAQGLKAPEIACPRGAPTPPSSVERRVLGHKRQETIQTPGLNVEQPFT